MAKKLPAVWVLLTGFKDSQEIYSSMRFFPQDLTPGLAKERFLEALSVMDFWRTSLNTLIQSVGDVLFSLLTCGLGGYVLSRLKPSGTKLVFMLGAVKVVTVDCDSDDGTDKEDAAYQLAQGCRGLQRKNHDTLQYTA